MLTFYLIMLVGWTIFTNTGKNIVYLIYLWYFEDHEMVHNFAWGDVALTHLYKALTATTKPRMKAVAGYMTMFQPNLYYYLVN
jgi:hypothetical protein